MLDIFEAMKDMGVLIGKGGVFGTVSLSLEMVHGVVKLNFGILNNWEIYVALGPFIFICWDKISVI